MIKKKWVADMKQLQAIRNQNGEWWCVIVFGRLGLKCINAFFVPQFIDIRINTRKNTLL